MNSDFTIIELFAGIGAQTKALKNIDFKHNVLGISEIDKYAIKSYEAIHGKVNNFGNICEINSLPYADLWTYSFPCQDISTAGKMKGINKDSRSGLLYEVERLLEISKKENTLPKYLLLENVKNLVGKKFKQQFDEWLKYLDELGYNTYWQILNAKDYGIPQNRERVFAISIRKDIDKYGYKFPDKKELKLRIKDIKEEVVDIKYYLTQETQNKFIAKYLKENSDILCVGNVSSKNSQCGKVYNDEGIFPTICACTHEYAIGNIMIQLPHGSNNGGFVGKNGVSPTITTAQWQYNNLLIDEPTIGASRGRNPENTSDRTIGVPTEQRLELNKNGTANTLTTVQKDNYLVDVDFSIRKLTPLECWRLMGFDDEDFYKAKNAGISDTQLYKQAGNSIVVNVLEHIFIELYKYIN